MIETKRLRLRLWTDADLEPYYAINRDQKVIEFLPGSLTHQEIKDFFHKQNQQCLNKGFMLWALEEKQTKRLMGFVGLNQVPFEAWFTPAVEIGWRLGSQFWGQGFATEAAMACLQHAFLNCRLDKVVAFTTVNNHRSRAVMRRCAMQRVQKGDFLHPNLPAKHHLAKHVLYALDKNQWPLTVI